MKQVVILAGGKGTRLQSRLGDLPKPMAAIGGEPLLWRQLDLARRHGFTDGLLLTGFRSEVIEEFAASFGCGDIRVRCLAEPSPLGSAGAVLASHADLADRFVVLYGDTMLDVDLDRLLEFHADRGADVTLVAHPNDHPQDSDLIETDSTDRVLAFHGYPHEPGRSYANLVNAALYVIERKAIEPWSRQAAAGEPLRCDFAKHLFPEMLARGARLFAYHTTEYIKDMGTPERYDRVCADFASGKISARRLSNRLPAVFLDRDGTLNEERGRIVRPEDLHLLPGAAEAVKIFNRAGLLTVVITNQPVIARGDCDEAQLRRIHDRLETLLGREGAYLDRIYHCPHHPDRGFAGERAELKFACECRKPRIGLIERAMAELPIDRQASWLIGDTTIDVQTASNAGLRSILLETGHGGADARHAVAPTARMPNLLDASRHVLRESAGKFA